MVNTFPRRFVGRFMPILCRVTGLRLSGVLQDYQLLSAPPNATRIVDGDSASQVGFEFLQGDSHRVPPMTSLITSTETKES